MNKTSCETSRCFNDRRGDPGDAEGTFSWVDAGGPKLRMSIAGNGSPAVVFDTGGGGSLELWGRVPSEVHIATELRTALRNANVPPPYILVGHTVGGLYVRVFAGMSERSGGTGPGRSNSGTDPGG